jgi:peptide/nickel transport system permease protein
MLGYIARRALIVIPTVVVISFIVFFLMKASPGNYVERHIQNLKATGMDVSKEEAERLTRMWGLDKPFYVQYYRWLRNITRGDLGRSMVYARNNIDLIKEALPVSLTIAVIGLLISWVISIPIGIYSATHQYSINDYVLTLIGFFGLGTPGFLIALLFAWASIEYFGFSAIGLVSPQYSNAPWNGAKIANMFAHIWLPIALAALTGIGGLMRTVRNNLLDQLRQPYVVTARAKGLSEWRLLVKYPLRLALNPFISSLAFVLPQIFAGDVLIAATLGLPTIGMYMFAAISQQDIYLGGTLMLLYAIITMVGTLISDILLAVVDPRIRLGGGITR